MHVAGWGWRGKRRGAVGGDSTRYSRSDAIAYLDAWVECRRGVEVYLEPATTIVEPSIALVAGDGEWTRRRIGSVKAAEAFADRHTLPLYEAAVRGYPDRMRAWTSARAAEQRAGR